MDDLLEGLRKFDALRDIPGGERVDRVFRRSFPGRPPEFAPYHYVGRLPPGLRGALAPYGTESLRSHQTQAIEPLHSRCGEE